MKFDKKSLLLYAVTDRAWTQEVTLEEQVEEALKAGVTCLQLREKNIPKEEFLAETVRIGELTRKYQVPFIINDDVEIALKCDADGVHVGQTDLDVVRAREILGENKIIGVSVQTKEQAILAWEQGADYLGVGAVFSTATKQDAKEVSFETLRDICEAVEIPVVAIGGIQLDNIQQLKSSGIQGVAVVSAIFGNKDIKEATKKLLTGVKDIVHD